MTSIDLHLGSDWPVLSDFMRCRDRVSVIIGPLGSGKTYASVQRILMHMCEQAPNQKGERLTRGMAIRNTYSDLEGTTIKDFLAVFDGLGRMSYGDPPTFHARFKLPDGSLVVSEMVFLALDRDDSVRKLKGYQLTFVWGNEWSELSKAVVDMADLRHGRYPSLADGGVAPSWHGMLGDTNSFDTDHWLYPMVESPPEGWSIFRQPGGVTDSGQVDENGRKIWLPNRHAENLRNLPEGYYARGTQGKADDWVRVMLANEFGFTITGKPVHPAYVDSVHCASQPIPPSKLYPLVLGMDFGRTPAMAICQYLAHAGRWVILDELCSEDMSAAIFGPEAKRYLDRNYPGFEYSGYGDPAGEQQSQATEDTPILIIRASGIPLQPAPSNVSALRRAALDNPLRRLCLDGRPALIVSPKAKMIRKGLMGGYQYAKLKVSGTARYHDKPEKNIFSHAVEALEYALLGGGEGNAALRPQESNLRRPPPVVPAYREMDW